MDNIFGIAFQWFLDQTSLLKQCKIIAYTALALVEWRLIGLVSFLFLDPPKKHDKPRVSEWSNAIPQNGKIAGVCASNCQIFTFTIGGFPQIQNFHTHHTPYQAPFWIIEVHSLSH